MFRGLVPWYKSNSFEIFGLSHDNRLLPAPLTWSHNVTPMSQTLSVKLHLRNSFVRYYFCTNDINTRLTGNLLYSCLDELSIFLLSNFKYTSFCSMGRVFLEVSHPHGQGDWTFSVPRQFKIFCLFPSHFLFYLPLLQLMGANF